MDAPRASGKGSALILGGILVIMFSADILLQTVSRVVGGIGALTPVLKTAIAYPLTSRFRTGVAMVMFAMIITTVVLMSVVIKATQSVITPDAKSSAGFDIRTSFGLLSFFDRVTDPPRELACMEDFPHGDVAAVGPFQAHGGRAPGWPRRGGQWHALTLTGMDKGFMAQARGIHTFQQRSAGLANDAGWSGRRCRSGTTWRSSPRSWWPILTAATKAQAAVAELVATAGAGRGDRLSG